MNLVCKTKSILILQTSTRKRWLPWVPRTPRLSVPVPEEVGPSSSRFSMNPASQKWRENRKNLIRYFRLISKYNQCQFSAMYKEVLGYCTPASKCDSVNEGGGARLNSAQFGAVRLASAQCDSCRLASAEFGAVRLASGQASRKLLPLTSSRCSRVYAVQPLPLIFHVRMYLYTVCGTSSLKIERYPFTSLKGQSFRSISNFLSFT